MAGLSTRAKVIAATVFGAAIIIMVIGPLSLLLLPNPMPVKVAHLPRKLSGTFISTRQGMYRLYPYPAATESFPADAFAVDGHISVFVKYRQLDALHTYGIHKYPDGEQVAVRKVVKPDRVLEMCPAEKLSPGRYYITIARDSMYGGEDYYYLLVRPRDR